MKTVKINTYTFNELSPEIQGKVLEKNRYINTDSDFWHESTLEHWKEKLKVQGFDEPKILFSGFGSQGDGACFTCSNIDFEKVLNGKYKTVDVLSSISHNGRYYYAKSTEVQVNTGDTVTNEEHQQIESDIEAERERIGNEIYKDLEKDWDYYTSDEAIKETFEANDSEFLKDGTPFNASQYAS